MALDIIVTTDRLKNDPIGRRFFDHIRSKADVFGLSEGGALYYDFPTYSDYETVAHKPDALLISARHGILALRFYDGLPGVTVPKLSEIDESLGQFCSILIGRLLKSKPLRSNLTSLRFRVLPVVFAQGLDAAAGVGLENSEFVTSLGGIDSLLGTPNTEALEEHTLSEIRSVVEGAKALTRPQKRVIENPQIQTLALALSRLEADIANFDEKQRRAALVRIRGPQRIRGLAGSGKTVILAMKAASIHLTQPEDTILITFYTRSLRSLFKSLITKFFRNWKDEDPNWDRVHIRHGWGGSRSSGAYADACRREGIAPMTFGEASRAAPARVEPFDFACRELLRQREVRPFYDHVLIDEGQDFPSSFYELCFATAKGGPDEKNIVWAYDELQNILNVKIRSPEELFGADANGVPRVSLERSSAKVMQGASNDTVLSKCYRNQREVLVAAHALGFGIYGQIVQLLESREHWEDVGYEVLNEGPLKIGEAVRILRPSGNSPLSIGSDGVGKIIDWSATADYETEIAWVCEQVKAFILGGLQAEDILVIALDDKNARRYFKSISAGLASSDIATNNIIADPYSEPAFVIAGQVTLSTVYRAKGNEAAAVIAVGVDAIATNSRSGRNKLFTAFTRTKAWLRVCGVGPDAETICKEIAMACVHFPQLDFTMPDLTQIDLIQRDLSKKQIRAKKARDTLVRNLRKDGLTDEEISEILAEALESE